MDFQTVELFFFWMRSFFFVVGLVNCQYSSGNFAEWALDFSQS
jgi:hypothetical protein